MHLLETFLLFASIFAFKLNKVVTNDETRQKLESISIRFNNFLHYLKDAEIREILNYFQKWLLWLVIVSFILLICFSFLKIKLLLSAYIITMYFFSFSSLLLFSIWWILNHKKEIKDMFSKKRILITSLLIFFPLIMLFAEKYYNIPFYEHLKHDPAYPFSRNLSNNFLAGLITISMFFFFFVLPYLVAIPFYICIYIPLKSYILFLRLVSKKIGNKLVLSSVILIDLIYGVWHIWVK